MPDHDFGRDRGLMLETCSEQCVMFVCDATPSQKYPAPDIMVIRADVRGLTDQIDQYVGQVMISWV